MNYRNILIIKPGAIGDLLQLSPVVRALHGKYPNARISLIVSNDATAALFKHYPLVHETIVFDKKGKHRTRGALWELWRRLRASRFDMVLNFQRSNLKAWFLVTAAFPCRILIYHKTRSSNVHAVTNHLETLRPLGIGCNDLRLDFYPGDEAERFAHDFFVQQGLADNNVVALNPGASHPMKCWSTSRFADLADLLSRLPGVRVVIVGGRGDVGLAEKIVEQSRSKPLVLAGKTDLMQLGAVLRRCAVLVSGDTGPMHMATAVNCRVIALFGATDPQRSGPVGDGHVVIQAKGIECVPCQGRRCDNSSYLECMEKIPAQDVFTAVLSMLKKPVN